MSHETGCGGVGEDWGDDVREGWEVKTIADVVSKPSSIRWAEHATAEFQYIDLSSVDRATHTISGTSTITGENSPSRAQQIVRKGDVIFGTTRPMLKRYTVISKEYDGQICSTGFCVLRPKTNLILTNFLFHLLGTDDFYNYAEANERGASYPAITDGDVKKYRIPLPPLPEQHRITTILDQAFSGIATARANTERNLQNAHELFESYLHEVFSERGEGWKEWSLGDNNLLEIIDGDRGVNYPKADDFREEGYCLFLNTKNVRPDGFDFETTMFVNAEKDSQLRKGKLKRDDVVMTTRGAIGNIGHYSSDVSYDNIRINSGMLIFRPNKSSLLPTFLFEILRSEIVKRQIKNQITGAAQPQLPIKTLVNFKISVPGKLEDQNTIVAKIRKFEPETQHLASLYQRKLNALDELKQSLLHQAFSGQL